MLDLVLVIKNCPKAKASCMQELHPVESHSDVKFTHGRLEPEPCPN